MGRELCTVIHRLGDVQLVSRWLWAGEVIRCANVYLMCISSVTRDVLGYHTWPLLPLREGKGHPQARLHSC